MSHLLVLDCRQAERIHPAVHLLGVVRTQVVRALALLGYLPTAFRLPAQLSDLKILP